VGYRGVLRTRREGLGLTDRADSRSHITKELRLVCRDCAVVLRDQLGHSQLELAS